MPASLAVVVEAALARRPEQRPATAEALAQGLRAAVAPAEVVLPGTPLAAAEDEDEEDDDDEGDDPGAGAAPRPPPSGAARAPSGPGPTGTPTPRPAVTRS